MSTVHSIELLILSQFEANSLLPEIRKSEHTRLHIYAPGTAKTMCSFRNLNFLSVSVSAEDHLPAEEVTRDLELFAGSLFFNSFIDYRSFRHYLALVTDSLDDIPEGATSNEGFVAEESREALMWPVDSPFKENPLPFLDALANMRSEGHGYSQSHVGSILESTILTSDQF